MRDIVPTTGTEPETSLSEMLGVNIVHAYSRAQALEDGVLVARDKALAREAGFKLPLAFSAAVEALITQIPNRYGHEDETGRSWDVLKMAGQGARRSPGSSLVEFQVIVHVGVPSRAEAAHTHTLLLQVGPGDLGEPVLTVMTPEDL